MTTHKQRLGREVNPLLGFAIEEVIVPSRRELLRMWRIAIEKCIDQCSESITGGHRSRRAPLTRAEYEHYTKIEHLVARAKDDKLGRIRL